MRLAYSILSLAFSTALLSAAEPKSAFTAEQVKFFDESVQPLLKAQCSKCHGDDPKKLKGELDLRTRTAALKGGETGPAAVPGKPAESLLMEVINHTKEGYEMPPGGKLKPGEIAVLTKWVKDGLAYPADKIGTATGTAKKGFTPEQKAYWAYQPMKRPAVPGAGHPVDEFLNEKLTAKKLTSGAAADKATLIRRAYYDLTGLPPAPEQVDAFVKSTEAKAWEKLIDDLLASDTYGEKWGRHWLDVVRYAESNGYERDGPKPNAWRYRDYVIRSFNADKPYGRFLREQVAGDEMKRGPDEVDPVVATGFYRLGVWDDEPADRAQAKADGYDDLVTITGQAVLGMTLNCARCHDHKGDPILQTDYYKMVAFFRDIREYSNDRNTNSSHSQTDISPAKIRAVYETELRDRMGRIEAIQKEMIAIEDAVIKTMTAEDQRNAEGPDRPKVVAKVPAKLDAPTKKIYADKKKEIEELRKKPSPVQESALSVNHADPRPPATFVNLRGNPHAQGPEVKPGFPAILDLPDPAIPTGTNTSGRRTVLADWLTAKSNPIPARVLMNRLWLHHFGKGLVPTPNDFGKLGEQPTHPELLEWLAAEFREPTPGQPWSQAGDAETMKRMHRLLLTSTAYQRASTTIPANMKSDPANTYLWRFNTRRLNAEEVRDSILAVTGELDRTLYGPSVYPKIPKEVLAGQSNPGDNWHFNPAKPKDGNRRTIYVSVKRSLQVPILSNHDQADPDNSCPVRYTTTVPTQALGMLNGEFTNDQAVALAGRLRKEHPDEVRAQVTRGIRLTTGRIPNADEVAKDVAFIEGLKVKHKIDDAIALAQYALMLLNTNEFVYLD